MHLFVVTFTENRKYEFTNGRIPNKAHPFNNVYSTKFRDCYHFLAHCCNCYVKMLLAHESIFVVIMSINISVDQPLGREFKD